MRSLLATVFRTISYPLVSRSFFYYPGMLIVRLSRKLREYFYKPDAQASIKIVRIAEGIKMKVDRNSYMGGSLYWSGFHHLQELIFLSKRLLPEMVFIDVGANQGEFSLFAASMVKKVLAFEPVSNTRNLLLSNIELNSISNISVYDFGLSDVAAVMPVYTSKNTVLHHGYHEGLSTLYPTEVRNVLEETISIQVFDDYFANKLDRVDFIKIDVEGAELHVLKGMKYNLEQFRPELLIEINNETFEAAGYEKKDLLSFLQSLNYHAYKINRGKLVPIIFNEILDFGNYVFKTQT